MARRGAAKRLRVRTKRLDQLDESKLALALWLLAKDTLTDGQSAALEQTAASAELSTDGGAEAA